jgi:glucosamine-6-phosphate deaminase
MSSKFTVDRLSVERFDTRREMGEAAAEAVRVKIKELLSERAEINMLFAAAPSQNEFLEALRSFSDIDWTRINALHMDEYVGLRDDAPQRFGNFLRAAIFDRVPFRSVWYLNGNAPDIDAECARYGALLKKYPLDIACTGIGENGHIAFNDPHVADFSDPKAVKKVDLDLRCRNQQVNDGCFAALDQVPSMALTLTVPTIFRAGFIVCVVPASTKAEAVKAALRGPVSEACPASILRRHPHATLYIDADSAALL